MLDPIRGGRVEAQTPQGQQPPPAEKPAKEPPPPLFPKHGRGFYKNNDIEVIDATPQSPPLEIDDPSVPDKGQYEINLSTDGDLSKDEHRFDILFLDANFGILPRILGREVPAQLKVEFPYSGIKANGEPYAFGIGGATLGLKFNFYNNEHTGVSMSVYPQLELSLPASADKGLADRGQTLLLPLLVSRQLSHVTMVVNGGLEQPFHDPNRKTTLTAGVGLGRALMRKFSVMSEIHGESAVDFKSHRDLVWNVGVMYGVRNVPVYARIGRSLFSDDGRAHTLILFGIKLISQPMHGGG
ncbi:MAG TPA: hypothetical protein VGZ27_18825 [Vicinamibacterales bacterium]|nr:hypothetical protein [Vicinamibacterales bacterium]